MDDEDEPRGTTSYLDNFGQLVALKEKFDPVNLFRVNQNVRPSVGFGSAALHDNSAAVSLNNTVPCSAV
jgi:berberine-like enzyme